MLYHFCVDNILRFYIGNAQSAGITVKYDVDIDESTNIQDVDLVAILANVLENAIHAAEAVKVNKTIDITIHKKGIKLLIIEIFNIT